MQVFIFFLFSFYQKNLLKTHREEIDALREQLKEAVTSRADAEAARKNDDVTWKERMTSMQEKHSKEVESLEKKHLEVLEIKLEEARLQWQQVRDIFIQFRFYTVNSPRLLQCYKT